MQIEKVNLSELKPAPYNPRTISDAEMEKLKRSIREFGYVEPIILNRKTGFVVGGNQRLKALQELGEKEVDVIVIDIPLKKEKVLNVALNRISGDWDIPKLGELMDGLEDIDLTGFDKDELKFLMEELKDPEPIPEELTPGSLEGREQQYQLKFVFDNKADRDKTRAFFIKDPGTEVPDGKKLIQLIAEKGGG